MPKSKINPEDYKDLVSTNKSLVADYKPLNFESLLARKALRVTHQGTGDEEYNPDPRAGFSIVSAYNDAIGAGGGTNKWKDNPDMYPVVKRMFEQEPENMGAHKYLQIIRSAKDMGLSDDEIYLQQKETAYAKGGVVKKTKKQMKKLFEDGGLLQEGGTVDKASGNEVPTGSLKKEVRDDIPAQLSEGEFVFPADVVRFIGLQKLMDLRQAAKEGLAKMEAMGQMGNADEATEDDTGEFETELDDILDEIEDEAEEKPLKKAKGGQLNMAAGGAVPQQVNPYSVPFSVERYSKEGQRDVFIPTFGGQTQGAIPEGFQKSTKVQSFGGVFREPTKAQPTVSSTLKPATTDTTKTTTTDLTKTSDVVPDDYKGLDSDTDTNTYLINLAKKDQEKYASENTAKGRAWGPGMTLDNPFKDFKDLKDYGTKEVQVGLDTDGMPIFETQKADLLDWINTQATAGNASAGKLADILNHKTAGIQKIEKDGDVYYQISGKTGGADRERMSQVYKEIGDSLVPVGKASFYKGAHPDAAKVKGIAQVAGIFAAPFTAGLSTSIGSAIMGAGAVGAQTVGSAVLGSVFNGLTAAATGGNIGKAMIGGAAAGALNANAGEITSAIIGAENVNSIANALNLKPAQVSNIFVGSIGSGVTTAIRGGDFGDVLTSFKDSLISTGVSEIAASNVMKSLSGSMDPANLRRIGVATKMMSNVALNAAMKGLDVDKAIKYYAPTVITRALTTPGGG